MTSYSSSSTISPPHGYEYLNTIEWVLFPKRFVIKADSAVGALRSVVDNTYADQSFCQRVKIYMSYKSSQEKGELLMKIVGVFAVVIAVFVAGIILL
jgi:hypothetical protein